MLPSPIDVAIEPQPGLGTKRLTGAKRSLSRSTYLHVLVGRYDYIELSKFGMDYAARMGQPRGIPTCNKIKHAVVAFMIIELSCFAAVEGVCAFLSLVSHARASKRDTAQDNQLSAAQKGNDVENRISP